MGYIAGQIADRCSEIVVLDNEDAGVALAREVLKSFNNVRVVKGDAKKLALPDDEFDTVLMTDVGERAPVPWR